MKKHEQHKLAESLAAIAREHGATAAVDYDATWREFTIRVAFPDVNASIQIDSMVGNTDSLRGDILVSWHNAARNLNRYGFQSVNTCHFRKASDVAPLESFPALFARRCDSIQRGAAFA